MNSAILTALYRSHSARVRSRVTANVLGHFDRLAGFADADAEEFAHLAAIAVGAAQRVTAHQTVAYMRLVARAETGSGFEPPALISLVTGARVPAVNPGEAQDATPLEKIYLRPFFKLWQDLHNGKAMADALRSARTVIERNVVTDLGLVSRNTAHLMVQHDERIVGWRRAASQSECGLCGQAAQHLYRREDPMPLHPGDKCFVRPAYHAGDQTPIPTDAISTPDFGAMFKEFSHA
jgi:hypothetical protein